VADGLLWLFKRSVSKKRLKRKKKTCGGPRDVVYLFGSSSSSDGDGGGDVANGLSWLSYK
jgi:hypothetical protein